MPLYKVTGEYTWRETVDFTQTLNIEIEAESENEALDKAISGHVHGADGEAYDEDSSGLFTELLER